VAFHRADEGSSKNDLVKYHFNIKNHILCIKFLISYGLSCQQFRNPELLANQIIIRLLRIIIDGCHYTVRLLPLDIKSWSHPGAATIIPEHSGILCAVWMANVAGFSGVTVP
jgi:hypothetical protein